MGIENGLRATLAEARAAPLPPGRLSARLWSHGSMQLRYYKPPTPDPQQPHQQDELYVVAAGSGNFICNAGQHACEVGDVLFAPAHAVHRFEDFTADFAVWVVFYGPDGGESA